MKTKFLSFLVKKLDCPIYDCAMTHEPHNMICSTAHICHMQQTVWKNVFIQTL